MYKFSATVSDEAHDNFEDFKKEIGDKNIETTLDNILKNPVDFVLWLISAGRIGDHEVERIRRMDTNVIVR